MASSRFNVFRISRSLDIPIWLLNRGTAIKNDKATTDNNFLFDGGSINCEKVGVKEEIKSKKGKEDLLK